MYKIIGADGQEYGPVGAEQIRQWIAENRLNAQSKIKAEGDVEWKTLGELPEFADALAARPVAGLPPLAAAGAASGVPPAQQVNGPAIGLIVTAVLGFLANAFALAWNLVASLFQQPPTGLDPEMQRFIELLSGTVGIISCVIGLILSGIVLYGAMQMKKLRSYGWAMAATIIALVPCFSPCCFVGLPVGIWALVVLLRPEVKAQFS